MRSPWMIISTGGSHPSCASVATRLLLTDLCSQNPSGPEIQYGSGEHAQQIRDHTEPILGRPWSSWPGLSIAASRQAPSTCPEPRPEPEPPVAEGQSMPAATLRVPHSCRTLREPRAGTETASSVSRAMRREHFYFAGRTLRMRGPRPHLQNTSREAAGSVRLCSFA